MSSRRNDHITVSDTLYLLERVSEPVYFGKGRNGNEVVFIVPRNFLTHPYVNQAHKIMEQFNSFNGRKIDLTRYINNNLLNIARRIVRIAQAIRRSDIFSLSIPSHIHIADSIINELLDLPRISDLVVVAAYIRDRINSELFVYVYKVTLMHRNETHNLRMPSQAQIFPHKFMNTVAVGNARRVSNIFSEIMSFRDPVEITLNAHRHNDPEQSLAYFREDIGLNSHHWHWHLVYPFSGYYRLVNKDRRGELFFYMHQQVIRRYSIERLCNNMDRIHLLDWSVPIKEAYYPMINNHSTGRTYASRNKNMIVRNINRPHLKVTVDSLEHYTERILRAIHRKVVVTSHGEEVSIDNDRGIDILGNMVESSILSPDRRYYGDLHNKGHSVISYVHDPDNRYHQRPGVMISPATSMRDPIFYRWHTYINEIFEEHKSLLPAYTKDTLNFSAIEVNDVEVCTLDSSNLCTGEKNILYTFMMKNDFNLGRGLDFSSPGPAYVKVMHLNHEVFEYKISATNISDAKVIGTVRIFMAPNQNFKSSEISFQEQKDLMIEMDRFIVSLEPGENVITRKSSESSVIIPMEQIFYDPDVFSNNQNMNYCHCGWPEYLLVPKGNETGVSMLLFVMISDYSLDMVHNSEENIESSVDCKFATTFCGLRNKKYPDARPMGFPFDRPLLVDVTNFESFKTPNMATKIITIKHSTEVIERHFPSNSKSSS